ncbi:MAG TPA: iron-containing alcohol dehydrogenase, partial [Flavobacterium sp.]|nr:iron-containing alcohol dehydrogenase [Flavobacterium sp.]
MFNIDEKYTYNFPTRIRFGAGVISELPDYLKENGLKAPLIVTDSVVAKLDFMDLITENLESNDISPVMFSGIHKNPVRTDVVKGGEVFDECKCDSIIGIGGGAALDVARAVALIVNHKEKDLLEYDELIGGDRYIKNQIPHFITVPTTAGTGSEVGRSAIISDDETHRKRILFHPSLMAKIVFADPSLTLNLPPNITAATGMDALTHHMEAYLAKNYHPMCEGIALEGMSMIACSIEKAVNTPDLTARGMMLMASLMGAVAFQKGLGVVHSLSHPLSSLLDTHHGLANAVNLPYGMRFNYSGNEGKFNRMAQALGVKSGELVIDYLFRLNKNIWLPANLGEIGV